MTKMNPEELMMRDCLFTLWNDIECEQTSMFHLFMDIGAAFIYIYIIYRYYSLLKMASKYYQYCKISGLCVDAHTPEKKSI